MNTAGMRPIVVVVGVLIGAASPCGLDAADPPGLVAAGGPAAGAADARLAVPPAAATRSSLGKIEEIFAKDYTAARTAAQKQALARTLFDESRGTKDAVDRWSLLRESMRLAAEAGDIDLAFAGVDAVVAGYRVDRTGCSSRRSRGSRSGRRRSRPRRSPAGPSAWRRNRRRTVTTTPSRRP